MVEAKKARKTRKKTKATLPDVFDLVSRVGKQLKQIHRFTVKDSGLSPPSYFVLQKLWERDGQPLKDLAEASGTTRATITGIVDTLERKGMVERTANPEDRRSMLVKVTAAGKKLRKKTPDVDRMFGSCCSLLTERETDQLASLLMKLSHSLSCSGPESMGGGQ